MPSLPDHHSHGVGHNGADRPSQWQTPHADPAAQTGTAPSTDFDLVEAAFVEGFSRATDAPSFIRLAGVPFVGQLKDGTRLFLLRVEQQTLADVGSLSPGMGGAALRYGPLPAKMASQRSTLKFIYFDGQETRALDLESARAMTDRTEDSTAQECRLGPT